MNRNNGYVPGHLPPQRAPYAAALPPGHVPHTFRSAAPVAAPRLPPHPEPSSSSAFDPYKCPLCTSLFTDGGPKEPRLVVCGHTICTDCLKSLPFPSSCPFCGIGIPHKKGVPRDLRLINTIRFPAREALADMSVEELQRILDDKKLQEQQAAAEKKRQEEQAAAAAAAPARDIQLLALQHQLSQLQLQMSLQQQQALPTPAPALRPKYRAAPLSPSSPSSLGVCPNGVNCYTPGCTLDHSAGGAAPSAAAAAPFIPPHQRPGFVPSVPCKHGSRCTWLASGKCTFFHTDEERAAVGQSIHHYAPQQQQQQQQQQQRQQINVYSPVAAQVLRPVAQGPPTRGPAPQMRGIPVNRDGVIGMHSLERDTL